MSDPTPPLRVAVTGASGLIGSALVERLRAEGHHVVRMVRRDSRGPDEVRWDPATGQVGPGLEGIDAAVHLAGETIAERWTAENKARIAGSRVGGTLAVAEAIAGLKRRPRVLVTASAVGIYGADRGDELLTEASSLGSDFLARVGAQWEAATEAAHRAGVRVVNLRFGVVISGRGGALEKMLLPFRLGLGGRVGTGRQWMSWIALDDVVELLMRSLTDARLSGPVNAVAGAATNAEFTATLARVLHRPALLPVPLFPLRLLYGEEMLEATLLASQRVDAKRLRELGYEYRHPALEGALRAALGRDGGEAAAG